MKRSLKDYLILALKGMAMGAADVVPGVSGGTIAFISGIYEELLSTISGINFKLLTTLKSEGFKAAWKALNGNFLLALLSGIAISILSLAKVITYFMDHEPIALWSFFFGLVIASILFVGKQIKDWKISTIITLLIGVVLAYTITVLKPLVSDSASYPFLFLAGAIAICAMILPGISGAFILVLLGAYQPILEAIHHKNMPVIAVVGAGIVVGLLSFSKLLKWLFAHYKTQTLAGLTGFIIGSLNKIWPWKEVLITRINSKGEIVPFLEKSISPFNYDGNPQLLMAITLSIVGFLLIYFLEKLAGNNL